MRVGQPRAWAGLAIAAAFGLSVPVRMYSSIVASRPAGPDAVQQNIERLRALAPLVGHRAGFCFALPDAIARGLGPEYDGMRVARYFQAQRALAPTVLVAVLGQPRTGFLDPDAANRARVLASLDTLVLDGPPWTDCWRAAREEGFTLAFAFPGGVLVHRSAAQ
jgi:hypothetical protein